MICPCGNDAASEQRVMRDLYDVITGSPLQLSIGRYYCLNCYNERLIAAIEFQATKTQRVMQAIIDEMRLTR